MTYSTILFAAIVLSASTAYAGNPSVYALQDAQIAGQAGNLNPQPPRAQYFRPAQAPAGGNASTSATSSAQAIPARQGSSYQRPSNQGWSSSSSSSHGSSSSGSSYHSGKYRY